jgi:hypothetical protein
VGNCGGFTEPAAAGCLLRFFPPINIQLARNQNMTTATLETTDATVRLKELAITKAEGGRIDGELLQDLLDTQRIERRAWLDCVDKLKVRKNAREMLDKAQNQSEPADLSEFASDRERLRAECQAKHDEIQAQIDELLAGQTAQWAPLHELDHRIARLARSQSAAIFAADRLAKESREILESTAAPGIDREILDLGLERERISRSLFAIVRPKFSREQARAAIAQKRAKKATLAAVGINGSSPFSGDSAESTGNGIANPSTILWQHDQADAEQAQLQLALADVECKLEKANASKLDWRNVALG